MKHDTINGVQYITKHEILDVLVTAWTANYLMALKKIKQGKHVTNMMVTVNGSTGTGKTSLMKEFPEFINSIMKKKVISSSLSVNLSMMDGSDIEMPVADHAKSKIVRLCAIEFDTKNAQLLELDEANRYLNLEGVNAASRVFLDREGSVKPTVGSLVVACANSINDAGTKQLPPHWAARGMHVYVTENDERAREGNIEYMIKEGYPAFMIEAYKHNPFKSKDDFVQIANYNGRTNEYAMFVLEAVEVLKNDFAHPIDESLVMPMISGLVGNEHAAIMMKHREMERLPTIGQVVNDPLHATIPSVSIDSGLRVKFAEKLIEDCKTSLEASKLAMYFARFHAEFARVALEDLAAKYSSVTKEKAYKEAISTVPDRSKNMKHDNRMDSDSNF